MGLLILTSITGVGPLFFTLSLFTLFANNAVFELLAKYEEKPEPALKPGEKPAATFQIEGTVAGAREYCNLHGLWKNN